MNALRFVQIVESYGANSARWPADEREAALEFASRHPTGQMLMDEASQLDELLSTVMPPTPSELLRARILKKAGESAPEYKPANDRLPFRALAATLLVSACIGFLSRGFILPSSNPQGDIEIATNSLELETDYAWLDTDLLEPLNER